MRRRSFLAAAAATAMAPAARAAGQAPGVTDTEIKFGSTHPYSGPASSYAANARTTAAYFRMINAEGGINGRMLNFLSYDDGTSPPKTVEQTRRLVEQDGVAFMFNDNGTPMNKAIYRYLNQKGIPHLFIFSGADTWGRDFKDHPWTIGWQPSYRTEAQIYAKYILANRPDAKIGMLYQNDDFGKDYIAGMRDVLGDKMAGAKLVSHELTDATLDSQLLTLKSAGVDTLLTVAGQKAAAMSLRRIADLDWKPFHIMCNVSISVGSVMNPAGPERATGLVSSAFLKDPTDPSWEKDEDMIRWREFMAKYNPDGDLKDINNVLGYGFAFTLVHVLRACGNDLSRENIMRQATNIDSLRCPSLLPGIVVSTSDTNHFPVRQLQMMRWDGQSWKRFGDVIEGA